MLHADIHSHLIPGIDDGSRSPIETIAMARGLVDLGVACVYMTPHQYKLNNDLTPMEVKRHTDAVWRVLARADVRLEVRAGAEYYYGERFLDELQMGQELITFDWDGSPHILNELPMHLPSVGVARVAELLLRRGVQPVMAHPQRVGGLSRDWDRLEEWIDAGWKLQLNLLSLVGRHGGEAREIAQALLEDGHYSFTGSDIHRPAELPYLKEAHALYRTLAPTEVSL
jgi:tyrosine-protein phosphatase YwqE